MTSMVFGRNASVLEKQQQKVLQVLCLLVVARQASIATALT